MRGRPVVPHELKVIKGTDQKCRRPADPPESLYGIAAPPCPKHFDADERLEWKKLLRAYKLQSRLVQPSEISATTDYVSLTVRVYRTRMELRAIEASIAEPAALADALVTVDGDTWDRREKALRRLRQEIADHTRLAAELGLTPSSRSRAGFAVPKAQKSNPWGNLGGKG